MTRSSLGSTSFISPTWARPDTRNKLDGETAIKMDMIKIFVIRLTLQLRDISHHLSLLNQKSCDWHSGLLFDHSIVSQSSIDQGVSRARFDSVAILVPAASAATPDAARLRFARAPHF